MAGTPQAGGASGHAVARSASVSAVADAAAAAAAAAAADAAADRGVDAAAAAAARGVDATTVVTGARRPNSTTSTNDRVHTPTTHYDPQTNPRAAPTPIHRPLFSPLADFIPPNPTAGAPLKSPSATTSPRSSREPSPAPRLFRLQSIPGATAGGMGSRRQDSHDVSPHRPPSISGLAARDVPSAAAIQRALSAATVPQLQPAPSADSSSRIPQRPIRTSTPGPAADGVPSWPVSPRLKSPPPTRSRRNSFGRWRPDSTPPPNITIQNVMPNSSTDTLPVVIGAVDAEPKFSAVAKSTNRGASGAPSLATVQEAILPSSQRNALDLIVSHSDERKHSERIEEETKSASGSSTPRRSMATAMSKIAKQSQSDSDDGKRRSDDALEVQSNDAEKAAHTNRTLSARPSFSSLRPKTAAEPATKSMTVETETVTSVAHNTLGSHSERVVSGRGDHTGTLRAKKSTDTIKPTKGRKRASRKAPSINTSGASTRADIFEVSVKNAMDEATSDDSDETFVYESNPPEPNPVRRSRTHSRTPSATSLASMGGRDSRNNTSVLNTQKTRSMKFSNAYNSDDDLVDQRDGTIRAGNVRRGGNSVHHHTGRSNRTNTGHASILDDDGPFHPQLNKVRSLTGLPGRGTQNARLAARSLHSSHQNYSNGSTPKKHGLVSYDMDAPADDEHTPLLTATGTVRTPRSVRRLPPRGFKADHYQRRRQGVLTRFAGCIAILSMLFLLIFGIVGFLFIITTPLTDVSIEELQSVLASETEIMFDMKVGAINPNLLPITVDYMDINVFAKSKYVGTEKWWREHPDGDWSEEPLPPKKARPRTISDRRRNQQENGVDAQENFLPTIPKELPAESDDSDVGKQTMLLGRVYHFDNPITFDASFLKRHIHYSTGAIRISQPGNRTELGGSERWERVLLHDFELIVRGTLKYNIPLGGKAYAASVGARVLVTADTDEHSGPGKSKGEPNGPEGSKPKPKKGEVGISHASGPLRYEVLPLHDDEALDHTKHNLKRRVWARVLRT